MKNVINWTIGSFFRTIGRIVAYIGIGCLLALILSKSDIDITNIFMPKLSAATLTSYDTYQKYWNQESGCGTSNKYSYTPYANNNPANDLWEQATIGTRVNSKAAQIGFNFQYNLTAGKYYDIVVNFASSDLSNALNTTNVYVESGTSCQDFNKSYVSLVGFTLSNSGTNYSNKATIRITANTATTYWGFYFYKGVGQFVAGPNYFNVSSITITEVQASDTDIIINNNTNNTQNIINNQNETTQQIIDSNKVCKDIIIDNTYSQLECGYLRSNGELVCNTGTTSRTTNFIEIYQNSTLYGTQQGGSSDRTCFYDTNKNFISCIEQVNVVSISIPSNAKYFRSTINNTSNTPKLKYHYCVNGNQANNEAINNLNDNLNNDTIDDSKVNNAINGMEIPQTSLGPFAAFLTIPLQWVQTILGSGQTCETLHLPLPFVNSYLDLPCMTDFWTATGAIGTLIQACWIAVVAVRIFNGLFLLTVDVLNPNPDSAAELTKIKSWEL